jgi:hypothetical protein
MQHVRQLTDAEIEALTEIEPTLAGGDAEEWPQGVTLLYVFAEPYEHKPTDFPGGEFDVTFPAGKYLRHTYWKQQGGWLVTGDAEAHVQLIEDAWRQWQDAPPAP